MIKEVCWGLSTLVLLIGCSVTQAAIRWDNPLPQGNVIESIAWNGSRHVAVGNSGTVLIKDGAGTWRGINSGTTEWLKAVTWAGSQFVVVGSSGLILTSTDGEVWTRRSSGTSAHLYGIAYAAEVGRLVAVGESGVVITSQDGVRWTRRMSNAGDGWLNDVTWNGNRFLAVGSGGTIIFSIDGVAWERGKGLQSVPSGGVSAGPNLQSVAWSEGRWVAVAADSCHEERCIYTSGDNGVTWQADPESPRGGLWAVHGLTTGFVAAGNDRTVLVGDNASHSWRSVPVPLGNGMEDLVALASDGTGLLVAGQHGLLLEAVAPTGPWERSGRSAGELTDLHAVALSDDNTSYVAVGAGVVLYNGEALKTPVPEHSSVIVIRNSAQGPFPELRDVAWGPAGYVAVGGAGRIFHSTNGTAWEQEVSGDIPQVELHGIAPGDRQWWVAGAQGTIMRKADGEGWARIRVGSELLRGLVVSGTELIVVGRSADGASGVVLRGPTTGDSFAQQEFPGVDFRAVAANGRGQYVIVGTAGVFLVGDGESWRRGVIDARFHLTDVVWDGTRYVVVGDGGDQGNRGNTFISEDGLNWERQTLSGNRLNGVATSAAVLVAVGEGGTVVKKACPCAMDDEAQTMRDTSVHVAVLANDIGEALYIARFDGSTAQGGSVSINGSTLTYMPPLGFTGTDFFGYTLGSYEDMRQDVAIVAVSVDGFVSGSVGGRGRGGGGGLDVLWLLGLLFVGRGRSLLHV